MSFRSREAAHDPKWIEYAYRARDTYLELGWDPAERVANSIAFSGADGRFRLEEQYLVSTEHRGRGLLRIGSKPPRDRRYSGASFLRIEREGHEAVVVQIPRRGWEDVPPATAEGGAPPPYDSLWAAGDILVP